jgi:hypothetical protein
MHRFQLLQCPYDFFARKASSTVVAAFCGNGLGRSFYLHWAPRHQPLGSLHSRNPTFELEAHPTFTS